MSASILVGYVTRYGSTQDVAEVVAATVRAGGLAVDCRPLKEVQSIEGYAAVVLGAPLYMFYVSLTQGRQALPVAPSSSPRGTTGSGLRAGAISR
jgi:flavorubredoxin